jgi:hypothetical protein
MTRPTGSKNKVKDIEPIKSVHKINEIKENLKTEKVTFEQTEPVKDSKCREFYCDHPKSLHYGPNTDWCNYMGCKCQKFLS